MINELTTTWGRGTWSSANGAWLTGLQAIMGRRERVAPRGKPTRELVHYTYQVPMTSPVVTIPERKLNYRFMAAEAYWILTGDDRVATIAPYNRHIAEFSDDGERFFGAYGPRVQAQLAYVVQKLIDDPLSRQAGMTLWREAPPTTRDVPCTVAIFFTTRPAIDDDQVDELGVSVFMRSSDVWLGIPYDVFNFSMLGHLVCGLVNQRRRGAGDTRSVRPGKLMLTAASAHLYDENAEAATDVLAANTVYNWPIPAHVPSELARYPTELIHWLEGLRDTKPGDPRRWWERRLDKR